MAGNTLCLSEAEVRELTNRKRSDAQMRALNWMGVSYRTRPDGSLAVLRSAVEGAPVPARQHKAREPNWEGLA